MLDPTLFSAYLVALFVIIITPGPDTLFVSAQSLQHGRFAGFVASLGIALGVTVHAALAGLGISALLIQLPYAFDVLRVVGAAYLLYLAWDTWRAKPQDLAPGEDHRARVHPPLKRIFRRGFITNVTNPKLLGFFIAFLPQFISPDGAAYWIQVEILIGLFLVCGTLYLWGVALIVGSVGHRLRQSPTLSRIQRGTTAAILAGVAVWLFVDEPGGQA